LAFSKQETCASSSIVAAIAEPSIPFHAFSQLNPDVNPFQKTFVSDLRRLDNLERALRFLQGEIVDAGLPVRPVAIPLRCCITTS
jgi:hypothetical protein